MNMNKELSVPRNVDPSLDAIAIAPRRPGALHWIGSQSLVITLLLVIVPNVLAMKSAPEAFKPDQPAGVSLIFSCVTVIICSFSLKRLQNFPGVTKFHYIMPVLLSCYTIAAALIFILRLNYSIFVLGVSFIMTLLSHFVLFAIQERIEPKFRYYIVRGGRADDILLPDDLDVTHASVPSVPTHPCTIIVADLHYDHNPAWLRIFAQAALRGIPVYHVTEIIETITGRVQIDHISENHFGSLLIGDTYSSAKRVLDVFISIFMLVILTPVFTIAMIAIKIDSSGPAIFRQRRVGFRGQIFEALKFRTMRVQDTSRDERASAMTQQDDHRITRVGRFLRRSRIDELPQLINVLRGEMSLIGPRPEALALSRWYLSEIPFYEYRHIVRPGITGWAQVNQGHVTNLTDVREKLYYDFFYVKNFSYWIDILIILRTFKIIVTGFGAK